MCNKKCGGFQEFTLGDGSVEIMVDVCVTCGQLTDVYTYDSDKKYLEYYNEKKDDYVSLGDNWKVGANSLFAHCPKTRMAYAIGKLLGGDVSELCFILNEEEKEEEQQGILQRMVDKYKIKGADRAIYN